MTHGITEVSMIHGITQESTTHGTTAITIHGITATHGIIITTIQDGIHIGIITIMGRDTDRDTCRRDLRRTYGTAQGLTRAPTGFSAAAHPAGEASAAEAQSAGAPQQPQLQ